jgi:hypothetical protein
MLRTILNRIADQILEQRNELHTVAGNSVGLFRPILLLVASERAQTSSSSQAACMGTG